MSFRKRLKKIIDRRMRRLVFQVFTDEIHPADFVLRAQPVRDILLHLKRNYQQVSLSRKALIERIQEQQRLLEERAALLVELSEQLQTQSEQLKLLTITHPLTKLSNRRGAHELFRREANLLSHHVAKQKMVSVMFLDLDRFKRINDELGHAVGDDALLAFADALREEFRESDILCHFSGDEFAVIMLGTNAQEAVRKAEEFLTFLGNLKLPPTLPSDFRLGSSIGIASLSLEDIPDPEELLEKMIRLADIAMYHAKRCGRNRAVVYQSGMTMEEKAK